MILFKIIYYLTYLCTRQLFQVIVMTRYNLTLSVFSQGLFNVHDLDKYQTLQMHLNSAQVSNDQKVLLSEGSPVT